MNRPAVGDALGVAHFLNLVSCGVLFYATVTRGGLAVARGLEAIARRAG
jgi:hypothetical protein